MEMGDMAFVSTFQVRRYECDAYDHLNNVNYVRFLSEATLDALARRATTAAEAAGRCWQANALDVEYLRPIRYGDTVEMRTYITCRAENSLRWIYEYRLVGAEELVARAQADTDRLSSPGSYAVPAVGSPAATHIVTVQHTLPPLVATFPEAPLPPPGVFTMRRRVTWQDLSAGRRVDEATYLAMIEACGMAVVEAHQWPAARMAAEGFAIILRRHQIEFRQPAQLDDELELATWVSGMQRATALRHYEIRRLNDGTLLTRGHTLGVWVNLATGRPMRIPARLIADFAPNIVS
jgi:acyl-CoA thioester hydrolase